MTDQPDKIDEAIAQMHARDYPSRRFDAMVTDVCVILGVSGRAIRQTVERLKTDGAVGPIKETVAVAMLMDRVSGPPPRTLTFMADEVEKIVAMKLLHADGEPYTRKQKLNVFAQVFVEIESTMKLNKMGHISRPRHIEAAIMCCELRYNHG